MFIPHVRTLLILLISLMVLPSQVRTQVVEQAAQDSRITAQVDKIFEKWDKPNSPGCALAVVKDDRIAYKRGYGIANLEYDIPITPVSVFDMASLGKMFKAMGIALLAQQGKLSLDDDVRKYIPEIPDYGTPIRIRHLVHHTSGLRDFGSLLSLSARHIEDVFTEEDALALITRQKELDFTPGDEWQYSNSGYLLLAVIIERVTGKSLRDYAQENIFGPLGMTRTHIHDDHTMIVSQRAIGYAPRAGGGFRTNISNETAGMVYSTVEDLSRWDRNLSNATVGGPELIKQLLTPGTLNNGKQTNYAFGLFIDEYRGLKRVFHGGSWVGYRAMWMRFPEQRFSVAVLCNVSGISPLDVAQKVAGIYLAKELKESPDENKTIASASRPIVLTEKDLTSKIGIYRNPTTGTVRRFFVKDGKLMLATGSSQVELWPKSQMDFEVVNVGEFRFVSLAQNAPPALQERIFLAAASQIYEAVQVVSPTRAQLEEYAGEYHSDELGVIYRFVLKEGKLVLRVKTKEDRELLPMVRDSFTDDRLNISFGRDPQGLLSGFMLQSGRIRNLRFTKQAAAR